MLNASTNYCFFLFWFIHQLSNVAQAWCRGGSICNITLGYLKLVLVVGVCVHLSSALRFHNVLI